MGVQAPIDRYMVSYTSLDGDTREMAAGKDRSITLTGLRPGMEYIIYIWAEKGTQQSKRASTEVLTGNLGGIWGHSATTVDGGHMVLWLRM